MFSIKDLLNRGSVDDLSAEHALDAVAQLIDHASDHGDADLTNRALDFCDALEGRELNPVQQVLLDYFRANAWGNRQVVAQRDRAAVWAWEQLELQKQVYYLRRALNNPAFESLEAIRCCQILTNLANQLDTAGRFVEARAYWTQALTIDQNFWMARGNRGRSLIHYANALYDGGHRAVFGLFAHRDLVEAAEVALQKPHLGDPAVARLYLQGAASIESIMEPSAVAETYNPDGHSLGRTKEERSYRNWCLRMTLFLNPLNDLESQSIAARDVLTLPNFVTALEEPPVLIGFFNQMKQEFVSSRWLYYEATHEAKPHFSDRDVLLYNTLDYPAYGLAIEKLKMAFRSTYSLFDKIAFFLNHYMDLGVKPKRVNFRSIWREKDGAPIRAQFEGSENWPFRGLYWLSKDLFEREGGYRDLTEPDAQALDDVRNHIEHKYLKVHEMLLARRPLSGVGADPFFDNLAYSLSRADFERKALRLLKLAREALTYLSLGMHREEERRRRQHREGFIAGMPLIPWEDGWKR
ncbi:MAG: LA2681 family HEPN domain-containing protein [Beijerinckiaceae bacterium]